MRVRRENIPAIPVSDWSALRIYPRFLCLIGPPCVPRPGRRRSRRTASWRTTTSSRWRRI
eukprot:7745675-Pyramimonas_sp.AAC.1